MSNTRDLGPLLDEMHEELKDDPEYLRTQLQNSLDAEAITRVTLTKFFVEEAEMRERKFEFVKMSELAKTLAAELTTLRAMKARLEDDGLITKCATRSYPSITEDLIAFRAAVLAEDSRKPIYDPDGDCWLCWKERKTCDDSALGCGRCGKPTCSSHLVKHPDLDLICTACAAVLAEEGGGA